MQDDHQSENNGNSWMKMKFGGKKGMEAYFGAAMLAKRYSTKDDNYLLPYFPFI